MIPHPPPLLPPLALARHPDDPATLAFAGVITQSLLAMRQPLIRGLNEDGFRSLLDAFFPGLECRNGTSDNLKLFEYDEFDDIVALLLTHRARGEEMETWLAHAIAVLQQAPNDIQDFLQTAPYRYMLATAL